MKGLVATATQYEYLKTVTMQSSDPTVAAENSTLNLQFVTATSLESSDLIKLQLPRWNINSRF
jgi:hypothetical protein